MAHSIGGITHRILRILAYGPAERRTLIDEAKLPTWTHKRARIKVHCCMLAMLRDGYVQHDARHFYITAEGGALLVRLNAGAERAAMTPPKPNVRIFTREAA